MLRTPFLLLALVFAIAGCDTGGGGGGGGSGGAATSTDAASCSTPKTRVIDRGLKGTTAGTGRGLWSDTKVIPGTQLPATAYYDGAATGGTASIKVSYWDGSKFNIEAVAADGFVLAGSATWVKLAFLGVGANKGRPIIVWTTGATTVKAAMRNVPFSSSTPGVWTTRIIDTFAGGLTRAAAISVSPVDHVAVTYITNAAATGRARFIGCDAGCTALSGFTAMTGTEVIENSNQAINIMGIDTGWCKADATTYYPVAVYHGLAAAQIRYAVCASGTFSNCLAMAGWSGFSVGAATVPVLMSLQTDPTATLDGVRILGKPAAATALTTYTSAGACNAPGAFTAGASLASAATAGTAWAKLMRDAGGRFHIVTNLAATNVQYINSATTNFQATAWNAAGTVETTTLPGVGLGAGGADIANSYGMIYTSFGQAVAPLNLSLGIVNDFTVPSNNAAAIYYNVFPDTTGGINVPLSTGFKVRNVSAANLKDGRPGVAYVDHSVGTLAAGRLKYALRSGATADSAWTIATLPNAINPLFPALAYDHAGLPWISFYDSGTFKYYLATSTTSDGSGDWTVYQAPITAKTGSGVAPATDDTAVAMYYSGGVAQPVLIYMNSTTLGGQGVRAMRLDPKTGIFGNMVTIDPMGASFGTRLTADFDTNGNIVIAYYDLTTTSVRFNFSLNGGDTWKPASAQVTNALFGREGLSIKLNPKTNRPAMSYYQASSNNVYLNECTTALASCNNGGNWTQTQIQDSTAVGVSGVTASTHEQMLNTSLTFSSAGIPYVAYMGGLGTSTAAAALAMTDRTTGFLPTAPISLAAASAPLAGVNPLSQGQYGMNVSAVRNSLGQFFAAHVGPNNWLYSTTCGD